MANNTPLTSHPTDPATAATCQAGLFDVAHEQQGAHAATVALNTRLYTANERLQAERSDLEGINVNLQTVVAGLQTELDLIKQELVKSQRGSMFLVTLCGQQQQASGPPNRRQNPDAEAAVLQANLDAALQANARLELRLAAFRRSNSSLEQRSEGRPSTNMRTLDNGNNDGFEEDDVFRPNGNVIRRGMGAGGAINWGGLDDFINRNRSDIRHGPWANSYPQATVSSTNNNAPELESVNHLVTRKRPIWEAARSASLKSDASSKETSDGSNQGEPRGTRIKGSDGTYFYVSTPPPDELRGGPCQWGMPGDRRQGMRVSYARPPLHLDQSEKTEIPPFLKREHDRLLSVATWIEDETEDGVAEYWSEYAKQNPRHSADEWRFYYQSQVRPEYLAELERKHRNLSAQTGSTLLPESIFNNTTSQRLGRNGKLAHETNHSMKNGLSDAVDLIDLRGGSYRKPATFAKSPSLSRSRFFPKEQEGLENGCEPCADINSQLGALPDAEGSASMQMRTARPVNIRSYSREDVKKHDLASYNPSISSPSLTVSVPGNLPPEPAQYSAHPSTPQQHDWRRMVFYMPQIPDNRGKELYRTVLINNLPVGITLSEVLDCVHGGRILFAKIVETAGMKTHPPIHTNAALVVFFEHSNAVTFVNFSSRRPISFQQANGTFQEAHVVLIESASHPVPAYLTRGIMDQELSRVVSVLDRRGELTSQYLIGKYVQAQGIGRHESGPPKYPIKTSEMVSFSQQLREIQLEFASVEDARRFHRFLYNDPDFSNMDKRFFPDPCMKHPDWMSPGEDH